MVRKPDRLLKAILIWTMLTLLIVWLPLVRGLMDGESYQWGNSFWGFQVGGRGVHGDYWLLVLQALFGITLLYLGWRGAQQPFSWLLLLWHVPLGVQATYNALSSPGDYRFRGDSGEPVWGEFESPADSNRNSSPPLPVAHSCQYLETNL